MKTVLLSITIAVLFGASGLALAADREEMAVQLQERVEQTRMELGLTDEQVELMRPILERSLEKQAAVLKSYGISQESGIDGLKFRQKRKLGGELKSVRKDTLKELSAVLSAEQLDAYEEMSDARRKEMRARLKEQKNQ